MALVVSATKVFSQVFSHDVNKGLLFVLTILQSTRIHLLIKKFNVQLGILGGNDILEEAVVGSSW